MDQYQRDVIQNTLNTVSVEPVFNMQQLVSHWETVMAPPEASTKKRGRTTEQTLVSEPLNANDRTKRRILRRS